MTLRSETTAFFHRTDAKTAETILLRGFAHAAQDWHRFGGVWLFDVEPIANGDVVLRIALPPTAVRSVSAYERPPDRSGARRFLVPPELLTEAYIAVVDRLKRRVDSGEQH